MNDQPVSSIMRANVLTVDRGVKVAEVIRLLAQNNIGAVVVTDGGKPAGIFSERDVLRRVVARGVNLEQTPVHLVMSPKLVTVTRAETIGSVGYQMHHLNLRHIPVVEDGALLGMVSIRDVLGVLVGVAESAEGTGEIADQE